MSSTTPALTTAHVARLGAESVTNLARLVFRRAHREHRQYDGFLAAKPNVRLVEVTRDPSEALGTFSRYLPGDVLLAWDEPASSWCAPARTTAFCPRVGWAVAMLPGTFEEVTA